MARLDDIDYLWTDKKRTIFGLPLSFTRYFVTDTKIITRKGFLNIREDELDIYKITDKSLELPLSQRMFGCGSVTILSKDVDTPKKVIQCVKFPRKVSQLISTCISQQRDEYSIRGKDMLGAGEHPHHDIDN
jgi:hypothetical protein